MVKKIVVWEAIYKKYTRTNHKKHLDGALPWHGPKSPANARKGGEKVRRTITKE